MAQFHPYRYIALKYKDTSLISIIGLLDMIGESSTIVSNPDYMKSSNQVLLFMAAIYFLLR